MNKKHNIKSVRETYQSLEELQHYDSMYNIASRLGFETCQAAWEANPRYYIKLDNSFVMVKPRKKHILPKFNCQYGAPMGMGNVISGTATKLSLIKLDWIDGDYTKNGVYWGNNGTDNIYYAYNKYNQIYVRASSRKEAKEKVRALVGQKVAFYN